MATKGQVKVQLLSVPDCPLVIKAQETISNCVAKAKIPVIVEDLVGDYNSPTVLVNGFDVTGQLHGVEETTSCRLDLSNEEQILAAIGALSFLSCEDTFEPETRVMAFKALLQHGERVTVDALSTQTGWQTEQLLQKLLALQRAGLVQLDEENCVTGACGLCVRPTRHEMSIHGRQFWAWCAFDVLGIFGALHASGFARSADPSENSEIIVNFDNGSPRAENLIICVADPVPGPSIQDRWCCYVNFFKSRAGGEAWMAKNAVTGSLLAVENVVPVAQEVLSRLGAGKD